MTALVPLAQVQQALADPATLDALVDHVIEGGTLISFCEARGWPYAPVTRWLYADAKRQEAMNAAVLLRGEWIIQRVTQELQRLGLTDIRGLFREDGRLKAVSEWPDDVARAIAGIEVEEVFEGTGEARVYVGDLKKVKLTDKTRALELLGKTLAMFVERHQVVGRMRLEELTSASWATPPVPPAA